MVALVVRRLVWPPAGLHPLDARRVAAGLGVVDVQIVRAIVAEEPIDDGLEFFGGEGVTLRENRIRETASIPVPPRPREAGKVRGGSGR